jgi:hypothetical protein
MAKPTLRRSSPAWTERVEKPPLGPLADGLEWSAIGDAHLKKKVQRQKKPRPVVAAGFIQVESLVDRTRPKPTMAL